MEFMEIDENETLYVSTEMVRTKGITRTAVTIYSVLLYFCTKDNHIVTISTNNLSQITGRCPKSIVNGVNRLIQFKYIYKLPKQSRTEVNRFVVNTMDFFDTVGA